VYITNDTDFIYMRVTLWAPGDLSDFHNNIFIDADNDAATGYAFSGIGSDLLIQGGGGYEQQEPDGFNNGTASALDWLLAPAGNSTDVEFRFSRRAVYDSNLAFVFTTNMIVIALEAENADFGAQNTSAFATRLRLRFATTRSRRSQRRRRKSAASARRRSASLPRRLRLSRRVLNSG